MAHRKGESHGQAEADMNRDSGSQLKAALRMFRRASHVRKRGFRTYTGTPEQICRTILDDAYDSRTNHYRVSDGHFQDFYVRDFALIAEDLVRLGYADRVRSTISYALNCFVTADRVTTSIAPGGRAFNFPRYGPDSLALLLRTIRVTKNNKLARKHHAFLQKEIERFASVVVDKKTLLPRTDKKFSSIRDHTARSASCYDASMVALVALEAPKLGLKFPYAFKNIQKALIETYWNGTYFFSDTTKQAIVVGDANVFPFWTGVITDKRLLTQAFDSIRAAGLDDPFPLRYVSTLDAAREKTGWHIAAWLAPGYETDALWVHLGCAYLHVLIGHDPALTKKHLATYERLIKEHATFLELYAPDGQPYRTPLYVTDEAMSWCAMWLGLQKRLSTRK